MNYPIWELDVLGGPTLVAFVSIIHVYVAQFAVGGGIFLFFMDRRAQRTGDEALLDFVRAHTRFFLLLTMVFGGVSGVGIWFTIALVNPSATSLLIHEFVFGWATEWVFFLVEIVALLVYHYAFDLLSPRDRLRVAGIYAFAAWASLAIIAGILSFMLTPGDWLESGTFWAGFFNPTLLPSVLFRTCVALSLAGLFAMITAMRARFEGIRKRLVRIAVAWLLVPVVGLKLGGWWYLVSVPEELRVRALELNPEVGVFISHGAVAAGLLLVLALVMLVVPRGVGRVVVALMLLCGLLATGSFEYLREAARKPWIIPGVLYANSLTPKQIDRSKTEGLLAMARWDFFGELNDDNLVPAGRELFNLQCLACHTRGGVYNDILPRTEHLSYEGLRAWLVGMGTVRDYMPPLAGTAAERDALAAYLASLHGKAYEPAAAAARAAPAAAEPPPREQPGEYLLLAWSDLGMNSVADCLDRFVLQAPGADLEAVLIHRADHPTRVTDGVSIRYALAESHRDPARHVDAWSHADASQAFEGQLSHVEEAKAWRVADIPVMPYASDGGFDPYPLVTLEAVGADGRVLATTQVVLPATTELGCTRCHDGGWRQPAHGAGVSDRTALNVLSLHDRDQGTTLHDQAKGGEPVRCSSCHADASSGAEGEPGVLSLSGALHGFHATTMHLERGDACRSCHPSHSEGPTGAYRGLHAARGLDCTMCHGGMVDHAAATLEAEPDAPMAGTLLAALEPRLGRPLEEILARKAWVQQPDCLTCHQDFEAPTAYDGFNRWAGDDDHLLFRDRICMMGLRCPACHGSPHALVPATNPVEWQRDNLQPLRASGLPFPVGSEDGCSACHTTEWPFAPHHPNMQRPWRGFERRTWVSDDEAAM
jgi:mono/diheme cytochrome c family protein